VVGGWGTNKESQALIESGNLYSGTPCYCWDWGKTEKLAVGGLGFVTSKGPSWREEGTSRLRLKQEWVKVGSVKTDAWDQV